MQSKIQKWGNSLAIRIPKGFADNLSLSNGRLVEMKEVSGTITISPVKRQEANLKSLLAGITKENLHGESDFGREGQELL
ncbi:MAG: AbrB/MazE/SpoVT family DNA-binding domain-containing protein [Kiritimatiellales bacterium]|nr:AbrB/MazE/SpoVT family DNA-binding domain-containing protein [Kiritimatiellales bacterium]MCF7863646.1 AbrB/MazE/SpoVT family DNA-binding domain-containing protein [Kiritimatiellales bacterium]